MKFLILTLLISCSTNKPSSMTVGEVYSKYGSKPHVENPYSKEQINNQKKYQEELEKEAQEREKLRKIQEEEDVRKQDLIERKSKASESVPTHSPISPKPGLKSILPTNSTIKKDDELNFDMGI